MGAKHTKPASQEKPSISRTSISSSSSSTSSNSFKSKFEEDGEIPIPKKQYITPSAKHDLNRIFFE